MTEPLVVVGAGLAGLACAKVLARAGRRVLVLDAADRVGGRVATDTVAGFRIDRGFQVYLEAYPEVPGVLAALRKRGIRTAVLTNGNAAMVDRAVASAGLADHLDAVLSVDDAQVFKTHPDAYRIALTRLAVGQGDVLFCSSNRWDVAGAGAFGFRTAWVNRKGLPDESAVLAPTVVGGSLDGLRGRAGR